MHTHARTNTHTRKHAYTQTPKKSAIHKHIYIKYKNINIHTLYSIKHSTYGIQELLYEKMKQLSNLGSTKLTEYQIMLCYTEHII